MKFFSLHMGETLVIGDAVVMLAERRNGGHHARLVVDAPIGVRFELRKRDGGIVGLSRPLTENGAQDAPRRAFPLR